LQSESGINWDLERRLSPECRQYSSPKHLVKFDKLCRKYWKLELDVLTRVCLDWTKKTPSKYLSDTLAFYQSTIMELGHRRGYLSKKVKNNFRKLEIALDEFEKMWGFRPTSVSSYWKINEFHKKIHQYSCNIEEQAYYYFSAVYVRPKIGCGCSERLDDRFRADTVSRILGLE